MTDLNYPQRWQHCDHHRRLQREVAARVAEARVNRACQDGKTETALFLGTLLVQHIRESDRELAAFLRSQTIDLHALSLPDLRTLKADGSLPADFDYRIAMGAGGMRQR